MEFDLVFEGGGAKGSVFVGALEVFEEQGHHARRFVGTSAGAITATLLAAKYRSGELLEAVNEKLPDGKPRFSSFMDIPAKFKKHDIENSLTYSIFKKVDIPWVPGMAENYVDGRIFEQLMKIDAYREMFSFIERGGLYAGNAFVNWLREKLDVKIAGLGDSTLAEFQQQTGSDLTLIASDTAANEMLILNHRTAPDCPVVWAVRMSMSIPFVWQEVRWKENWGSYRSKNITGDTIVDGGVLSNFPIHLLTSTDESVRTVMGDTDPNAVPNLGFLIDEKLEVATSLAKRDEEAGDEDLERGMLHNVRRLKTVQRISRLIDTMTDAHDRQIMEAHEAEICRLPAKGYGTTEFDMSDARLTALLEAGRKAMRKHFQNHPA